MLEAWKKGFFSEVKGKLSPCFLSKTNKDLLRRVARGSAEELGMIQECIKDSEVLMALSENQREFNANCQTVLNLN